MSERFPFRDLRELFAKANEEKSGDQLAGLAARSEQERVAAKQTLADLPLRDILANPLISPDEDDVSRLILETHDRETFASISSMTVGELREFILSDDTDEATLGRLHRAITPEMAAAVAKLMSNKDLVLAANKGPRDHALPQYHGRARRAGYTPAAEPSGGRRGGNSSLGV